MGQLRYLLCASLLVAACGDSPASDGDAAPGTDAGVSPDAEPDVDANPSCNADEPFEWPAETEDVPITPSSAWKNQVSAHDDPFLAAPTDVDSVRWIKFAVLVKDPTKVYFQDSSAYAFHYDFATAHLDPFMGLGRSEFDHVSLFEEGQEVILGTVLFPPRADRNEIAIQLVRQDAFHPEMARIVIDLVAENVVADEGATVLYFPTFEQHDAATACSGWFAEHGIIVDSVDRWSTKNSCYSGGWALGRLVYVEGSQIAAAYEAGTLRPADILLTDAVPAEIPFVAGILTQHASTPNSHVAILARSYGIPFAHLALDSDAALAGTLVGKEIVFRADSGYEGCSLRLIDVDSQLSAGDRDAILALKDLPELAIPAIAPLGALSASTDGLTRDDVKFFGGKAANFGLLRAAIPDSSPQAIAFSFDLWTAFLDQTLGSGKTLRQEISDRLSGFSYPPDVAQVELALAEIRTLIKGEATFTSAQQADILTALAGFDANEKIRFRSSTNMEDTEHFVGAGLYDSYSGCVADDQDSDDVGPSLCDATKAGERGVFRAIRKVYASFYNTNAYLERLRHGVDEAQVGMALLIHPSFPDEIELANGVATGDSTSYSTTYELATQAGAVSVANPEGGATPELVSIYASSLGIYPTFLSGSSLVPLGGKVLDWPDEYEELGSLLKSVSDLFATLNPSLTRFLLDFEYKKVAPGDLVVKQVRQLPLPDPDARWPVYLVDEPSKYCVFQGEYSDVFSVHRLKSIWNIATKNQWLDATTLESSFYDSISLDYLDGATVSSISGDPAAWPDAAHTFDTDRVLDSFSLGSGAARRDVTVEVPVETEVPLQQCPLRSIRDHSIWVQVRYATPVPTIDWTGVATTDFEAVRLGSCPQDNIVTAVNHHVEETVSAGGVSVQTAYYWPEQPTGIVAGYTAPLYKWDQTTITGLTSTPIVLTGYYSQTYRPAHHNFASDYIFDPWLEPGIDQGTLDELEAANIRFLVVLNSSELWTLSLDGVLTQIE